MDYRLPIESWVSYTVDRFICTIDVTAIGATDDALYLGCHSLLNTSSETWFDAEANRANIDVLVRGLVEATRMAYNAAAYPEALEDATRVPKSSVLYLDNALCYLICDRFKLRRWAGVANATYYSGLYASAFRDAWLDCMVFLRAIRTQYSDTITDKNGEILGELGTAWYTLTPMSGRCL